MRAEGVGAGSGRVGVCLRLISIVVVCAWQSCAGAETAIEFDIPQQRADRALIAFAEQADITLLFSFDDTVKRTANKLHGRFSVSRGLEALIAGSGLTVLMSEQGQLRVAVQTPSTGESHVKNSGSIWRRVGAALATAILGSGSVAQASDAPATQKVIEEVIVTAQKRSQSIQDVAASISAIGSYELESRGIRSVNDIQFAVPSMQFAEMLGERSISIRGIGAFSRQPGVSVSIDGVYQSRTATAQLSQLDLERLEVLRGPQGTLYGRNSNGGVVNFITAAPTEEAEGYLRVGYAEFDEASIQGVYSGPITDRISIRIAANHTDRGEGWIENLAPGEDDLMQGSYNNVRLKLAVDVSESLDLALMYAHGEVDGPFDHYAWHTDNRELAVPGIPQLEDARLSLRSWEQYASSESDSNREYDLFSVTANWELGFASLKSITAVQEFLDDFASDRDSTDLDIFVTSDISNTRTLTQEFNLVGGNGRLDWVVGMFYMDDEWDRHTVFNNPLPIFGLPLPSQLDFDQNRYKTESIAAFVDGTWHLTDNARISAGVRRTEDDVSERHRNQILLLTPDPLVVAETCDQALEEEWKATTVRIVGQYDPTDSSNAYLSYSEGYKAGGVAMYECAPAYDPEEVAAYELGYKGAYFGGRATLSGALFYYDYSDFQVTQVIGLATATVNAGDAEVKGAEIEAFAMLGEAWAVSAAVTLIDATYGDFINLDGLNPAAGFQQLKGNRLNAAPETSINFGVLYTTRAFWGGTLTLRADAAYRSRTFFREFNAPEDSQPAYTVVNANASWESVDGAWEARLFAKNLGDEVYLSSIFGSTSGGGRFATFGMPRQVGLELTRRFGAY